MRALCTAQLACLSVTAFVSLAPLSSGRAINPIDNRRSIHERQISTGTDLPVATLDLIKTVLASHANDTWVSGTQMEALLELDYSSLSVFSPTALPPHNLDQIPVETNAIIADWAAKRPSTAQQMAVVSGGSAGDPASLGVAWLLAAQTMTTTNLTFQMEYVETVLQQVTYLLQDVPQLSDGTISMRPPSEPVQLWADYMYMVPPFLAYFGAVTGNTTLLDQAYNQSKLYRQHLINNSTGLWTHVALGTFQDTGEWATGNGWAAAGMTRVLASMQYSAYSAIYQTEMSDLTTWINQILDIALPLARPDGLLPNYFNSMDTFSDVSSSALLAATAFRMSFLGHAENTNNVQLALSIREAVITHIDPQSGWTSSAVDPLNWDQLTDQSPESEAFVLLLEAAWRDWANQQPTL